MARKTSPDTAAIVAALAAAGIDLTALVPASDTGVEVEAKPNGKRSVKRTPAKRTPAKSRATAKRTCNITAGEAWEALGSDPEFKPGNLDKPASGPMLWRLNDKGMLADLLA